MSPSAHSVAREIQLTAPMQQVTFHGRSMEPFLRDGDDLRVEPVTWADVVVGDIVTYRLDDRFPTLRVVEKRASRLVLRGDNWPATDFDAWPDDLLGRVHARTRDGRTITRDDWAWRLQAARMRTDATLRRHKRRAAAHADRVARVSGRLWRGEPLRGDALTQLHINVSASCNLGCRMCPYLSVHDDVAYGREMTQETFARLLPSLARVSHLQIAGAGEPLFNRQVVSFIEQARAVNPTIEIAITTNGSLLTDALIRELMRVRLTRLTVSIDGATSATVGAIRLGINFDKVIDRLRALRRLKDETGSRWPVLTCNYVVGYGSYTELPQFLRLARTLGVESIQVLDVVDGSQAAADHDLTRSMERDQGRAIREAIKLAQAYGIALRLPLTPHGSCTQPYVPHISEDGALSPCCFVDYEGRTLWHDGEAVRMPSLTFGSVHDQTLEQIWHSPAFRTFRLATRRGAFTDSCRTCHSVRVASADALRRVLG